MMLPRQFAIALVRGYQWTIAAVLPPACRYHPSCSHYAIEALTLHGLFKGSGLALWRIARCHPWGGEGFDPVPPRSCGKICKETSEVVVQTATDSESSADFCAKPSH